MQCGNGPLNYTRSGKRGEGPLNPGGLGMEQPNPLPTIYLNTLDPLMGLSLRSKFSIHMCCMVQCTYHVLCNTKTWQINFSKY